MDAATATVSAACIAALASGATAVFTLIHNRKTLEATTSHNHRTLSEQRSAEKRRQLNAALQELLFPLYSRLMAMQAVFKLFAADKPKGFRTLEYLLSPETYSVEGISGIKLSESDKRLLDEVVGLGKEIEELILAKGSLANEPVLQQEYLPDPQVTDISAGPLKGMGLFSLAVAHLRLFRLAWEHAITGDPGQYKNFVYPRELNTKVFEAIQTRQRELAQLG